MRNSLRIIFLFFALGLNFLIPYVNSYEIYAKKFHPHQSLLDRFPSYKSTSSVGKVRRVIRGDLIELENGIRVKLQDVIAPPVDHPHEGLACFGQKSQKFLAKFLIGRKVFLQKDRMAPEENGNEIVRYVYVMPASKSPPNPYRSRGDLSLLNLFLVEEGYAKFYPEEDMKSGKFWGILSEAQEYVYQNPVGAWVECLGELEK